MNLSCPVWIKVKLSSPFFPTSNDSHSFQVFNSRLLWKGISLLITSLNFLTGSLVTFYRFVGLSFIVIAIIMQLSRMVKLTVFFITPMQLIHSMNYPVGCIGVWLISGWYCILFRLPFREWSIGSRVFLPFCVEHFTLI